VRRVRPTHTSSLSHTRKNPHTKTLTKTPKHKENKRLIILASVSALHMNLPLALWYLYKAKEINVEGVIYADLEYVYIVKNNVLIKIPTREFKVSEYEI
jgi:collagenase-like PrtC family protease